MHPNPVYRSVPEAESAALARDRGFGILAVSGAGAAPLLAHVPFLLDADGGFAELHLVRSNPIARATLPAPARIAVSGPDGYVSPDWYGLEDQVPTWNYVAVHLTGTLEALPQADLPGLLERLSARFEGQLAGKKPWTMDKMTPDVRDRMMRMIAPFRLRVSAIDGTWKLGQNKPEAARHAAADQLGAFGIGADTRLLAALMKAPPSTRNDP